MGNLDDKGVAGGKQLWGWDGGAESPSHLPGKLGGRPHPVTRLMQSRSIGPEPRSHHCSCGAGAPTTDAWVPSAYGQNPLRTPHQKPHDH